MPNYNETTGIPFGVIAGNSLDSDVLHDLMFGSQAENMTYAYCLNEARREAKAKADAIEEAVDQEMSESDADQDLSDRFRWKLRDLLVEAAYCRRQVDDREAFLEEYEEQFAENYQGDEEVFEGELDGVQYRISWLGGAIIVFIAYSPVISKGRPCSPCVPGACDLDSEGDYEGYGVPADWLAKEYQP